MKTALEARARPDTSKEQEAERRKVGPERWDAEPFDTIVTDFERPSWPARLSACRIKFCSPDVVPIINLPKLFLAKDGGTCEIGLVEVSPLSSTRLNYGKNSVMLRHALTTLLPRKFGR